jgi:Fic family protein
MSDLERFLHDDRASVPLLIRAGLAHVQFETILDGNGRVGRLLITLQLCHSGMLREPLLYLSIYFKRNRSRYYELLDRVRRAGEWETWLSFFLEGVGQTAEEAVTTARRLDLLFTTDRVRIAASGRRAGSALRVHEVLKSRPITSIQDLRQRTGLSFPAAAAGVELLGDLGIARELTGKRRNRIFAYEAHLAVLNEGTEPI